MNKPDIPPELVQLCDPWLQRLWDLRGTYAGTQIDFDVPTVLVPTVLRPTLGADGGKHGSHLIQPSEDP